MKVWRPQERFCCNEIVAEIEKGVAEKEFATAEHATQ